MPNFKTHYDNLQVSSSACEAVIRAAYRSLAQKYHPDKFDGAQEDADRIMKILNESYEVLIDPELRRQHDQWVDLQNTNEARNIANETVSEFQRLQEKITFAPVQARNGSLVAFVVKPVRYKVILIALFSIVVFIYGIDSWMIPIGGPGWTGTHLMIPNHYWQLFERFAAVPFGMFYLIWFGQLSMSSTLMVVSIDGIWFCDDGERIVRWSEINQFSIDDEDFEVLGYRNGKKWGKSFPKWLVAGECSEIIEKMQEYKTKSLRTQSF